MTYDELRELSYRHSDCAICNELFGDDYCGDGDGCIGFRNAILDIAYKAGQEDRNEATNKSWHDGFASGYEAAASNPKAWWVPGKNDERLRIGDTTQHGNIIKLGYGHYVPELAVICSYERGTMEVLASKCEKIIPDSKEKIINELASKLIFDSDVSETEDAIEMAEQFYDRITEQIRSEDE